jgi:2-phosphosulfolactate phosphatase
MVQVVCEWGLAGVDAWASRASAFVIVDVLSFSTAVSVAVDLGASVIPFPYGDPEAAAAEAEARGAVVASPRRALGGQLSLSPSSLRNISPGARVLLPSPNGSRLSLATGAVPTFCGSFRNAAAVAKAACAMAGDGLVVVIAAGERWPDQSLRPAIEDWLGAGAVIDGLDGLESSEARLARASYVTVGRGLGALVRESISGRELIDRGFEADVEVALEVQSSNIAPVLIDGEYRAAAPATR